ncbi:inovirus Gp2 family protein [Alkalimonas collagenimarina]|uniref:Inovirus Gp2 family protein n=1 Tax=Alkalimonas collagenimarina TaxID=400390 RepID=A0ABT9H3I9_9GAMM|nr:inovirus Gp2 family protein [Alkalimonas collagenimarina]MDP4537857.1 inovirus Gp2 family protein [Alkalimonas collagenimarina]
MFNSILHDLNQPDHKYWNDQTYYGWPLITHRGPLLTNHLDAISKTFDKALMDTSRAYAVRFDLRLPCDFDITDSVVVTRFFNALRRLLETADMEKAREGKRVHPHKLRYCWAKEWGNEGRPHYHVLIILNHNRYRTLGSFKNGEGNLSARIKTAWAIALNQNLDAVARLVHFPKNAEYRLYRNSPDYQLQAQSLFYRASYFAKAETKVFGIGQRSLGTSLS